MNIPEEAVEAAARTTWGIKRQEINDQMVERGEHVRLESWEDVGNKEPWRHQPREPLEAAQADIPCKPDTNRGNLIGF